MGPENPLEVQSGDTNLSGILNAHCFYIIRPNSMRNCEDILYRKPVVTSSLSNFFNVIDGFPH